jgi:hypothetical protein
METWKINTSILEKEIGEKSQVSSESVGKWKNLFTG